MTTPAPEHVALESEAVTHRASSGRADRRRAILASAVLFVLVWTLYALTGTLLNRAPGRPLYGRELLFEADIPRLVLDITSLDGPHYRSTVHPIFVLLANPFGSLFAWLLGGRTTTAAILYDALAGALAAVVSLALFKRMAGGNWLRAWLATLVTVFSMSRLFFSSIPETYALASLSLAITYLLFWIDLNDRRLPLSAWVVAGTMTFGTTVTNLVQTLLCFGVARYRSEPSPMVCLIKVGGLAVLVVTATAGLSLLQGGLYPTESFLGTETVTREFRYIKAELLQHPSEVLGELVWNVFVVGVIGPTPQVVPGDWSQPRLTFGGDWVLSPLGYIAVGLWATLALAPSGRGLTWFRSDFATGLGLCVLYNLLLHAVYFERTVVIEYFIYSAHFSFAVTALVLGRWVGAREGLGTWLMGLFLAVLALNNLDVINRIIAHYR
jgi:hypothetical protein